MSATFSPYLEDTFRQALQLKKIQSLVRRISTFPDIVVFSHLRWEFVKQRPQHILSRMAKDAKVLFIEEPIGFEDDSYGTSHTISVSENVTVVQPRMNYADWETLEDIVYCYMDQEHIQKPLLWFYSPAFVNMIDRIEHSSIVFDCMDELSAFKGASPELLKQESLLMSRADVVFTGGKSLYDAKKDRHDFIHCFPSSVDRQHFEKAIDGDTFYYPKDLVEIPKPIAGFYGVIDERIDLQLLDEVAKQSPAVSFVMIGPVVKINPKDLPVRKNIFYLGSKSYDELPEYLQHFTVAMMPFALNESTKFISPTKTLEFMAALKPIVSTPIYDVVRDYQDEVSVAYSAEEFSQAIIAGIQESDVEKLARVELQKAVLQRTSWSKTVASMKQLILQSQEKSSVLDTVPSSTSFESNLAYNVAYSS